VSAAHLFLLSVAPSATRAATRAIAAHPFRAVGDAAYLFRFPAQLRRICSLAR
jgi:hypothetical protein